MPDFFYWKECGKRNLVERGSKEGRRKEGERGQKGNGGRKPRMPFLSPSKRGCGNSFRLAADWARECEKAKAGPQFNRSSGQFPLLPFPLPSSLPQNATLSVSNCDIFRILIVALWGRGIWAQFIVQTPKNEIEITINSRDIITFWNQRVCSKVNQKTHCGMGVQMRIEVTSGAVVVRSVNQRLKKTIWIRFTRAFCAFNKFKSSCEHSTIFLTSLRSQYSC